MRNKRSTTLITLKKRLSLVHFLFISGSNTWKLSTMMIRAHFYFSFRTFFNRLFIFLESCDILCMK